VTLTHIPEKNPSSSLFFSLIEFRDFKNAKFRWQKNLQTAKERRPKNAVEKKFFMIKEMK
jgi:hypothetical protein